MVLNELRILSVNFGKIRISKFLKYSNVTNAISIFDFISFILDIDIY